MKIIEEHEFVNKVKLLLTSIHYSLPDDFLYGIKEAIKIEDNELAKDVLLKILENVNYSSATKLPLCQDTGFPIVFVKIGKNTCFNFDLIFVINKIVQEVYEEEKLRKSCVLDPLKRIYVSHCCFVYTEHIEENEKCIVEILVRGGGSENTSFSTNFLPTTEFDKIINYIVETTIEILPFTCPPIILGIGIGGSVEQNMLLAKKALFRKINSRNKDNFYAEVEKYIKDRINMSNIGPLGLGGKTSVLDVFIETAPTHIATLPVSVVLQCHSLRRGSVVI